MRGAARRVRGAAGECLLAGGAEQRENLAVSGGIHNQARDDSTNFLRYNERELSAPAAGNRNGVK